MLQGIKKQCLKMSAIPGGKRMPDQSKMFAPAIFIMVKSDCEKELIKANKQSVVTRGARRDMSTETLIIIVVVLFLIGGGGWGYSRWRR